MAFLLGNKFYISRIYRILHVEFGVFSFYNSSDVDVHTDREAAMAQLT